MSAVTLLAQPDNITMDWDPLSIIAQVVRTLIGWTVVIFVTIYLGMWLGLCLGEQRLCMFFNPLIVPPMLLLGWLLWPTLVIFNAVTILAWYIPIRCETYWVCAAGANLLAWMIATAWFLHSVLLVL